MGFLDLIAFWRSGKLKEALDVWEAIQARSLQQIADELGDVAELFGLTGMDKELNELAAAIKNGDPFGMVSEACDPVKLIAEKFRAAQPSPTITTLAAADGDYFAAMLTEAQVDPAAWWEANKDEVRRGMRRSVTRLLLRRELREEIAEAGAVLAGSVGVADIDPIRRARLEKIIIVLKGLGAAFPPWSLILIVVAVALELWLKKQLTPAMLAS